MNKAPLSGRAQLNYRAEPRRCLVLATPAQPKKLVEQARAARNATPQRSLADDVGRALREFYTDVLAQPFPPEFAAVMESLERPGATAGIQAGRAREPAGVRRGCREL